MLVQGKEGTYFVIPLLAELIFLLLGQIPQGHVQQVVEVWARGCSWFFVILFFLPLLLFILHVDLKQTQSTKTLTHKGRATDQTQKLLSPANWKATCASLRIMKPQSSGPVWAYSEDDWGITLFWASFQAFTGSDSYPLWIRTWISSFLGLFSANRHFRIVTQCSLLGATDELLSLDPVVAAAQCSTELQISLSTSQLGHVEELEQHLKKPYLGDLSGSIAPVPVKPMLIFFFVSIHAFPLL